MIVWKKEKRNESKEIKQAEIERKRMKECGEE